MGHLRDRMEEDLRLAGYSQSTRRIYLHYAKQYAKHYMRSPAKMGEKEIRAYLLYLLDERKLSHASYRQAWAALKFLYTTTMRRPWDVASIPRKREGFRLVEVLSGTEVSAFFKAVRSFRYRVILMGIYSAGLRVVEACRLRVEDIDSHRMVIHVRSGKGNRDRYVMLSERFLKELRRYYKMTMPDDLFFPGRGVKGHIGTQSVRNACALATKESGIKKRITPHILRHSFATHLHELGADVLTIKSVLGHKDLQSTNIYTHISTSGISKTISPLDVLGTPEAARLG